jgi:hypothetical protein
MVHSMTLSVVKTISAYNKRRTAGTEEASYSPYTSEFNILNVVQNFYSATANTLNE